MSGLTATLVGVAISAVVGLVTVWINDRRAYKRLVSEQQQTLIDQLQEERKEIKDDVRHLRRMVDLALLQGHYKDDYINILRAHIEQRKPPPPPEYPAALLRIVSEGL